MDLLLEVLDNKLLDKFYAQVLPKSYAEYLPATPEFVKDLVVALDNGTKAAMNYSEGTRLESLARHAASVAESAGRQVYGVNAPYHLLGETPYTHLSLLSRSNMIRQVLSLFVFTTLFGWALYFSVASFSYYFVYDKDNFNHPRYLKNQMSMEIKLATEAIPVMVLLTIPWFLLELHGYSQLYWNIDDVRGGWPYIIAQFPLDVMFTDCGIYLIHRWLHWPSVYKRLHKPHHKWIVCTPFASHAFHPVDGYAQSLPYHWYPFLFPLHKVVYLIMFTFVNFWTVMIHDGQYLTDDPVVNGAACHTVHHLYFNYNYGQFCTLWDRLGGTYRKPDRTLFDPNARKNIKTWKKQAEEMEEIREVVEGCKDDRVYDDPVDLGDEAPETKKTQ